MTAPYKLYGRPGSGSIAVQVALEETGAPYELIWVGPQAGTVRHAVFLQWMVFLSANVYEAALRMYYSARYSARGEQDAEAIRTQGTEDFCTHLALISHGLGPYVLGS